MSTRETRVWYLLPIAFGVLMIGCGSAAATRVWPPVPPTAPTLTPTPIGTFSVLTTSTLHIRKSVKGTGTIPFMGDSAKNVPAVAQAGQGNTFLVLVFPSTSTGFDYNKNEFVLQIPGGQPAKPDWFTLGFGSKLLEVSHYVFDDSFCDFYNIPVVSDPGVSRRLAVAFEIPAGSGSGTITIKNVTNSISWP